MKSMTTRIPSFGMPGVNPVQLTEDNSVVPTPIWTVNDLDTGGFRRNVVFSLQSDVVTNCLYNQVHGHMSSMQFGTPHVKEFLESLKQELPSLIGDEVEKRVAAQLDSQKTDITNEISGAKDAMLAKKSNSIVTLNGSILGSGKITEAYTKTIELLQCVGKALRGDATVESNVDNVSFPRQLARSMLNGAKGSLKITAGGLGAAMVMSAVLATSGIALNKVHEAFPSVPSATSIVSSIATTAEALKVSVGSIEIEKAGGPTAKTLSVQERATDLLAQNSNDYDKTISSVNTALGLSYMNSGSLENIEMQKQLLTRLQQMQMAQNQATVVSAASTPASGPNM